MAWGGLLLVFLTAPFARAVVQSGIPPSLTVRLTQPSAKLEFTQALSSRIDTLRRGARVVESLQPEIGRETAVVSDAARAVILESLALPRTLLPRVASTLRQKELAGVADSLEEVLKGIASQGPDAFESLNQLRRQSLPPGESLRSSTARATEFMRLAFDGEKAREPADLAAFVESQIASDYEGVLSQRSPMRVNINGYMRPIHFRKDTAVWPSEPLPFLRASIRVRNDADAALTFKTLWGYYQQQTGTDIFPVFLNGKTGKEWDGTRALTMISTQILEGEVFNRYGLAIFDSCRDAALKLGLNQPRAGDLLLTISPHAGRDEPYMTAKFMRALARFGEMTLGVN